MARPANDGGFPLAWTHYALFDGTRQPVWESAGMLAYGGPGGALGAVEWVAQLTSARTRVPRAFTRDRAKKFLRQGVGPNVWPAAAGRAGRGICWGL